MDCILIGDGSLLMRCGELLLEAGHGIRTVVTRSAANRDWARGRGLHVLSNPRDLVQEGIRADYLFSIANLRVLSERVLACANRGAFNFHDGPLPGRAGLNVPVWALLEGARDHAITWHQMLPAVDAGAVAVRRDVEIRPDDTAFTLNLRCADAGLDGFRDLLAAIGDGGPKCEPQAHGSRFHAGSARPARLGTIDPHGSASDALRLVRGLDFGGHANPLAVAKLWTGRVLLAVGAAEPSEAGTGRPGELLEVSSAGVVLATAEGAVRLAGLSDMAGAPVCPVAQGLMAGDLLPQLPAEPETLSLRVGEVEARWRALLEAAVPVLPGFQRATGTASAGSEARIQAQGASEPELVAAFMAWLAGLTGTAAATAALISAAPLPWIATRRPLHLEIASDVTPAALTVAARDVLASATSAAPMATDLALRLDDPAARERALHALDLAIAPAGVAAPAAELTLALDPPRLMTRPSGYTPQALAAMAEAFGLYLERFRAAPDMALSAISLGAAEIAHADNSGEAADLMDRIAAQAGLDPQAEALRFGDQVLDRGALLARAEALAGALAARGAGPGRLVALCLPRSTDLVVAMLAVLRCGAAYLPLDPAYPAERIGFMLDDSGADLVIAGQAEALRFGVMAARLVDPATTAPFAGACPADPQDIAYVIYTSGSTGRPKGVAVRRANLASFAAGMDGTVPLSAEGRLLAVTSVSFDISVLEILWALARGATVVLQDDGSGPAEVPDFSLFYFASEASGTGHDAYRLLLEGAKFADANGFSAVWTPERHFHAFGGLYPNPAIAAAALAAVTRNIELRAGSCVAPLHHPLRIAEDWALVDNLSNGRAGVALAAGWQPNDFVLNPQGFTGRKQTMLDTVDTLRRLWRGESLDFAGHDGKPVNLCIHPRPVRADIPLWLTAAGNPETFAAAARLGCGVLTHLLGQTFEEVAAKIAAYRAAWREAGHPGDGHVVLMLHTYIGETEADVAAQARGPMRSYLKSAVDLVRRASWSFPTIVERATARGMTPNEMFDKEPLSESDLDQLLDHAFERYYHLSGLFGTVDSARAIVERIRDIDVDEIGCLIDFGIAADAVLEALPRLKRLMDAATQSSVPQRGASLAADIIAGGITHLQCTPSMAAMLVADPQGPAALRQLECLMVGGESLPPDLARDLRHNLRGALLNMYGPTETTVWSAVAVLDEIGATVPLGAPIRGTVLSVRSPDGRTLPHGAEGELWIGGAGVAAGYLDRPDLTAERFVETPAGRFYRTGDLVRLAQDGRLSFLGRIDNQIKLRGHRIELGEIEAALAAQPGVARAAVRAVTYGPQDQRLVGYVVASDPARPPEPSVLRTALGMTLPAVMVPAAVMIIDRMPLTPNGKTDLRALPVPGGTAAGMAVANAPGAPATAAASAGQAEAASAVAETGLEETIALVWQELLGLAEVPVNVNFFDLGGHSLLVVQLQRRLKADLGTDLAIADLFRFTTIRSLAAHLASRAARAAPSPQRVGSGNAASDAAGNVAGTTTTGAERGAARAAARLARMGRGT